MHLPVEEVLPQLLETLRNVDSVVLEAPPGAGKTTLVPLKLAEDQSITRGKILLLEPRRIAARSAAERMASMLKEPVGQTVGYRVRGESKVSASTRIEVITEGILIRMLQSDPALSSAGVVIFDEFHERNLDADLGLALALYSRDLFRDSTNPLKLLVMSATLDGNAVASLLGEAPVISSQGRHYPVDIVYQKHSVDYQSIEQVTAQTVNLALENHTGDILVFLPGKKEIHRTIELLCDLGTQGNVNVLPLYGDLPLPQQRAAVSPCKEGERKVVVASAIAESSLTIEGVRVVIDSGYSRLPAFDPRTAMTRLNTGLSSKASCDQRAGRAGRLAAGTCYRLWPASQHDTRSAFTPAEIRQADLAPLVLTLYRFGVNDPHELQWLDQPPAGAYRQAETLLTQLGALTVSDQHPHRLTTHGEKIADFPLHPRLAHMLVTSQQYDAFDTGCLIAALLSSRDPLPGHGADITSRVNEIRNVKRSGNKHREVVQLIAQIKRQCVADIQNTTVSALHTHNNIGFLIASAYPDRIAKKRNNKDYQLANGRAARINRDDPLSTQPWLAVAQVGGTSGSSTDSIYLAAELDETLFDHELSALVEPQIYVKWPATEKALIAQQQNRIGQIVVSTADTAQIPAAARVDEVIHYLRRQGLQLLPWSEHTRKLIQRVNFLRNNLISETQRDDWPDLNDDTLLASLETWLAPWLEQVSHVNHFATLNMQSIIDAMLPWDKKQQLDALAPTHFQVPSGSRIRIDYSEAEPVLAVKLQEMLGSTTHPAIGNGYPLKVSLLSPAGRQIQLTADIPGFWSGSYEQVKKDMKSRYPKHFWPDDPTHATASSRTVKPRPG